MASTQPATLEQPSKYNVTNESAVVVGIRFGPLSEVDKTQWQKYMYKHYNSRTKPHLSACTKTLQYQVHNL